MRLKAVTLENFRRYRERTVIPIGQLTAFIGRNDVGKSTILEALDIFFEGEAVKIESADAYVGSESKIVKIGAIFGDLPASLDLDRGAKTSLQAEHLLNADGDLEIVKVYNCAQQKVPAPKVFAIAMHPSADGVSDLLQKNNTELKKLVREHGVEANCQLSNNPSMRQALYSACAANGGLALAETEVPLNDADAKNIWEAIKRQLPMYMLFRSDRPSSDQDPEVQNPMKAAIRRALAELAQELHDITKKVQEVAESTARRTLEQLRSSFPDLALASVLTPQFREPSWPSVFKLDLESDDQIPLNKRGSGVRRLILMSFFQAEAERARQERVNAGHNRVPIIYAIEEPETSQHPDNQERIIRALREIADAGDQVIITTHVPGLAGLVPVDSVRHVDTDPDTGHVRVREGSKEVLSEVAEDLGVLPDAADRLGVRVAVAVEGFTDIDALVSFATVLANSGELNGFDQTKIFWTIGGGSTLKDWVERRYLDRLGIPQIFIFDSDRTSAGQPPKKELQDRVTELNARPNCQAFLTRKRNIENYVHVDAVSRASDGKIVIDGSVDHDYGNMASAFGDALAKARDTHGQGLGFYPVDHSGKALPISSGESNCKKIISAFIMRQMTADEIKARGAYTDPATGGSGNEILEWLNSVCQHLA
jgi:hypothetical protein